MGLNTHELVVRERLLKMENERLRILIDACDVYQLQLRVALATALDIAQHYSPASVQPQLARFRPLVAIK